MFSFKMVSMVNDCTDATLKDIESENETKNDETKKVSLDINSWVNVLYFILLLYTLILKMYNVLTLFLNL